MISDSNTSSPNGARDDLTRELRSYTVKIYHHFPLMWGWAAWAYLLTKRNMRKASSQRQRPASPRFLAVDIACFRGGRIDQTHHNLS